MLQSIHIQSFKGFKDTEVGPFKKVNLILGGQNVGKTSLLEAVYACVGFDAKGAGDAFRLFEGNDQQRYHRSAFANPWLALEANFDDGHKQYVADNSSAFSELSKRVEGLGRLKNGRELAGLSYHFNGTIEGSELHVLPISMYLPNQVDQVNLFGKVILARKKKQLLELLQQVEPRLESLDAVSPDGEQRIYADIDGLPQALQVLQLGHGFNRLLVLFAQLLVSESRLVLVDEVENGIHYSALPTLFEGIKLLAKERDIQSIITTHSLECIKSAYEVFQDKPEDFQLIRLERTDDGNVRAIVINDENLKTVMESGWEIR